MPGPDVQWSRAWDNGRTLQASSAEDLNQLFESFTRGDCVLVNIDEGTQALLEAVGRRETVQNDSQSQELDDRYTLSILHTGGGRSGPWHKAAAALHEICRAVLRSVLLAPNSVGDADAFDRLLNQNPDGTSILDAYLFKPEARTGVSKSFAVDKGLLTAVWSQDSGVQIKLPGCVRQEVCGEGTHVCVFPGLTLQTALRNFVRASSHTKAHWRSYEPPPITLSFRLQAEPNAILDVSLLGVEPVRVQDVYDTITTEPETHTGAAQGTQTQATQGATQGEGQRVLALPAPPLQPAAAAAAAQSPQEQPAAAASQPMQQSPPEQPSAAAAQPVERAAVAEHAPQSPAPGEGAEALQGRRVARALFPASPAADQQPAQAAAPASQPAQPGFAAAAACFSGLLNGRRKPMQPAVQPGVSDDPLAQARAAIAEAVRIQDAAGPPAQLSDVEIQIFEQICERMNAERAAASAAVETPSQHVQAPSSAGQLGARGVRFVSQPAPAGVPNPFAGQRPAADAGRGSQPGQSARPNPFASQWRAAGSARQAAVDAGRGSQPAQPPAPPSQSVGFAALVREQERQAQEDREARMRAQAQAAVEAARQWEITAAASVQPQTDHRHSPAGLGSQPAQPPAPPRHHKPFSPKEAARLAAQVRIEWLSRSAAGTASQPAAAGRSSQPDGSAALLQSQLDRAQEAVRRWSTGGAYDRVAHSAAATATQAAPAAAAAGRGSQPANRRKRAAAAPPPDHTFDLDDLPNDNTHDNNTRHVPVYPPTQRIKREDPSEYFNIRLQPQGTTFLHGKRFVVKGNTRLQKLFDRYCEELGVTGIGYRYEYKGQALRGEQFVDDYGMGEGEVIDVVVPKPRGHKGR